MKKTYINPTCKVRAMKTEPIMVNTVVTDKTDDDPGIGWGGPDTGGGTDAKKNNLWEEE